MEFTELFTHSITTTWWRFEQNLLLHFYQNISFLKCREPNRSSTVNVHTLIKSSQNYTSFKCSSSRVMQWQLQTCWSFQQNICNLGRQTTSSADGIERVSKVEKIRVLKLCWSHPFQTKARRYISGGKAAEAWRSPSTSSIPCSIICRAIFLSVLYLCLACHGTAFSLERNRCQLYH